jgi:hypothetical protein
MFICRELKSSNEVDLTTFLDLAIFSIKQQYQTVQLSFRENQLVSSKLVETRPTCLSNISIVVQGFQNNPAAAGAPAGGTRFTAGYFV